MIIGFDGKRAVRNATGLGNYSRLIIDQLSKHYPEHQYRVYSPTPDNHHRMDEVLKRDNVSLHLPEGNKLEKKLWRSIRGLSAQAKRDGVDILHGLSAQLPLDVSKHRLKSVVTVHDLIFCHFPKLYGPFNTAIYKFKCRRACEMADRIVAVSECTKRDIIKFLNIPAEKIDVVYQGCNPIFSEPVSDDAMQRVQQRYDLPDRFLLNVGTIEERKNVMLIVKALEHVADKDIHLVVVGRKTKYTTLVEEFAQQHGLERRVHILTKVPTLDLPALYHSATAFIYPSRFEGFGIPIIEAQSCGAPVIAATGSCLEEAAGPDALFVNPDSTEQMTEAIDTIVSDESLRQKLIEKGYENVKRFAPETIARNMMNVYQEVMK